MKPEGAPQEGNTESIDYNFRLAEDLSTLFTRMQDEGKADQHIDEILRRYEAINVYAEEGSMSESDRIDPNDAMDNVATRDEISALLRPIEGFLRSKGKIK